MPGNSKSCHNCRRRRLRCDRSWPGCHKCAVSGQECLGYGKVFVWTRAIGTRGHAQPSPSLRALISCPPSAIITHHPSAASLDPTSCIPAYPLATTTSSSPGPNPSRKAHGNASTFISHHGGSVLGGVHDFLTRYLTPPQSETAETAETTVDAAPAKSASSSFPSSSFLSSSSSPTQDDALLRAQQWRTPTYSTLTDPLFQDLDRNSRYYLSHFADRVCKDLVARDAPGANPFRELIPLTNRHPLLLQILVATSAIHRSNISRPMAAIPPASADPGVYLAQLRSKDTVSRQALIDALSAKQKAMGHLQRVLNSLDPAGSEVALVATHFFIKFDLIDLDKRSGGSWRAHLQGASSILAFLTSTPERNRSRSSLMPRDWVIADCFIYHILGSTLGSGRLAGNIARFALEMMPVMKRVQVNSYLSCPPEILHIILKASQLSYETSCAADCSAEEGLALIDEALAFDIQGWADRLRESHAEVADLDSRMHMASAHRSAVCLYILQALPLVRSVRAIDTELLVSNILDNLDRIGDADPYFKATSWPTLIAGAETRDAEKRSSTMKRLLDIWRICPWGYIFTAMEMLRAAWAIQDSTNLCAGESAINWLKGLKGMGFDHLIV